MTDKTPNLKQQLVIELVLRLADLNRARAVTLLAAFNTPTARALKADQYDAFITEAEKQIAVLEGEQTGAPKLRDLFAIAALQSPAMNHWTFGPAPAGGFPPDDLAERAYQIADAMLARRKS